MFDIEKWECECWKAREKVVWESVLRFLIRPIVSEIISLNVTCPNSSFSSGYFLLIIIILRPFFAHLFY